MIKSIIIFGKGPSVLKCTRDIVDQYNDIAICNYPVLNDFFINLIKDREILYHFANCGTFDNRYTNSVNKKYKIKNIINTNVKNATGYSLFLNNKAMFIDSIREKYLEYFKKKFELDPSTGVIALQYLIDTKKYNKILLVGFDNYKKGKQTYYYKPDEYNSKIKYLLQNNIISKDGKFMIKSGHDPEKTMKYIDYIIKNTNIEIKLLS